MSTTSYFDTAALKAIYSPYPCEQLVDQLCEIHSLCLAAMASVEKRASLIEEIDKPLASMGVSLRHISEGAQAIQELEKENRQIQEMASRSVVKVIVVLNQIMQQAGASADDRATATGSAIELCLAPLPQKQQMPWRVYFDQVCIALACAPEQGAEPTPASRPRL